MAPEEVEDMWPEDIGELKPHVDYIPSLPSPTATHPDPSVSSDPTPAAEVPKLSQYNIKHYSPDLAPTMQHTEVLGVTNSGRKYIVHVGPAGTWVDQNNLTCNIRWWTWLPETDSIYDPNTRDVAPRVELLTKWQSWRQFS